MLFRGFLPFCRRIRWNAFSPPAAGDRCGPGSPRSWKRSPGSPNWRRRQASLIGCLRFAPRAPWRTPDRGPARVSGVRVRSGGFRSWSDLRRPRPEDPPVDREPRRKKVGLPWCGSHPRGRDGPREEDPSRFGRESAGRRISQRDRGTAGRRNGTRRSVRPGPKAAGQRGREESAGRRISGRLAGAARLARDPPGTTALEPPPICPGALRRARCRTRTSSSGSRCSPGLFVVVGSRYQNRFIIGRFVLFDHLKLKLPHEPLLAGNGVFSDSPLDCKAFSILCRFGGHRPLRF